MRSLYRSGFAILEIIIVVAVLALLVGAGLYVGNLGNKNSAALPSGAQTPARIEGYASATVQQYASGTAQQQKGLDQLQLGSASNSADSVQNSAGAPVKSKSSSINTSASAASVAINSTSTDPLAGLGSDIYAAGILPLGDGKYTTTAPKKGYVYLCNVAQGGEGAEVNGPWIGTSTWNSNGKIGVQGNVSWPNDSINIAVSGTTRTITTNDLPVGATTGIFPIESTDPAYQYDTNPNSIEAQNLSFSLPANPTLAAAPSCIYGEVGVMTNGVLLLDAFDAEYRDAAAHEMQDSCGGHPHQGGMYHYHSLSACIADATVTNVIGWAFDGYPITGPEISTGRYLTTADLDECHGITSPVMIDGKMVSMYHYVMTQDFPYSVSCFRGTSYEPKPGPSGGGGASGSGMGGMNMPGMSGQPSAPPQAAIDACNGKASGANCTVSGGPSGTCATIGGDFACKPE